MEEKGRSLSATYRALAGYLENGENFRDEGSPAQRLDKLEDVLDKNGVTDPVQAPIRSADSEIIDDARGQYERLLDVEMEQFDVERAVRGLVFRIADSLESRRGVRVKVEEDLTKDKGAVSELLRAVCAETGKELRMIVRPGNGSATLYFETQIYRARTRFEKAIGPVLGGAAAKLIELFTGAKTVSPKSKGLIDTCETSEGFMRDYCNEWAGFMFLIEGTNDAKSRKKSSRVAAEHHARHGVLIRPYKQYFPAEVHEVAINDKNRAAIEELDKLAAEANAAYEAGELSASKLKELAERAKEITLSDES